MLLTTPRLPLRCEIASDSPAQFVQVFEIGISLVAPTPDAESAHRRAGADKGGRIVIVIADGDAEGERDLRLGIGGCGSVEVELVELSAISRTPKSDWRLATATLPLV